MPDIAANPDVSSAAISLPHLMPQFVPNLVAVAGDSLNIALESLPGEWASPAHVSSHSSGTSSRGRMVNSFRGNSDKSPFGYARESHRVPRNTYGIEADTDPGLIEHPGSIVLTDDQFADFRFRAQFAVREQSAERSRI